MSSSNQRRDDLPEPDEQSGGVSRRNFLKGSGLALTIPLVASGERVVKAAGADVRVISDKTAIKLTINGTVKTVNVEPRVTLLDALRNELDITGAKRVCDRGTCGACTVIADGKTVYSCSMLAIEAQGRKIETVESLEKDGKLHPVQQAFWDNDAQQCGFCTPGFVMSCKALLDKTPNPTKEQMEAGPRRQLLPLRNLCRHQGRRRASVASDEGRAQQWLNINGRKRASAR